MKILATILAVAVLTVSAQAQSGVNTSNELSSGEAASKFLITKNADGTCTQDGKPITCPSTSGLIAPTSPTSALSEYCKTRPTALRCKNTN